MKKTIALAVVAPVIAASLSACGGDGGGGDTEKKNAKSSAPAQQILDASRLASAVLDGADMPDGYIPIASDPVYSGSPSYFCNYTPPATALVKIRVQRHFISTADASESINLSIRQFADAKAAKASFAALDEAMKTCKSETTGGSTSTYTTSAIADLGDAGLRVGTTYEGGGSAQLYALKGPVIVSAYGAGSSTSIPDDATLQALLTKQLDHYLTVAANPPANEADQDGDGAPDVSDAFPFNEAESVDTNENGIGDNSDAHLKEQVAKAKFLSQRDLSLIAKDPAAHAGRVIKIWGNITQFDSATGTTSFLANFAATNTTSYGYFEGDDAYFSGGEKLLKRVVEKDTFTATVRVIGSYTYATAAGGTNTVPYFEVRAIQVQ